jgi:ParB family chromosome partitioning protein
MKSTGWRLLTVRTVQKWWTPTAAGYFEHVSKAKTLEAVTVFAPDQVTRLSKLKKGDLASEAERLAAGSGWLPAMLCAPSASERADAASPTNASSADQDGESGQE